MEQVDITWGRALKVWWSYSWRAFVLMLLIMVPLGLVLSWYVTSHFAKPGADPTAPARMLRTMATFEPVFFAVLIALQVQAMRWMLNKARWSDFRVAVLPRDQ